jgi:hypothetical protein
MFAFVGNAPNARPALIRTFRCKKQNIHAQRNLGREAYLRQEVKVPLDRWALRNSRALCGIPFREAKRGLLVDFVYCRLHTDME